LTNRTVELIYGAFLYQVPLNLHGGYRRGDLGKREFILKETTADSNELEILKFLGTIKPPSENVISLVDMAKSSVGWFIVLPTRVSISSEFRFSFNGGGFLKDHFI